MRGDKHRDKRRDKHKDKREKHTKGRERGKKMGHFSRKHAELSISQLKKAKELLQLRFIIDAVDNIPEFSSQLSAAQRTGLVNAVNTAVDEIKLQSPTGPPSEKGAQKKFLFADTAGNQIIRYTLSADAIELDKLQEEIDDVNQKIADFESIPTLTDQFIADQIQVALTAGATPAEVIELGSNLISTQSTPGIALEGLTNKRKGLLTLQTEVTTQASILVSGTRTR